MLAQYRRVVTCHACLRCKEPLAAWATHLCTHTHALTHARTHTHACTCTRTHTHTHAHTRTHTRTHAHTHARTHINTTTCQHNSTPAEFHTLTVWSEPPLAKRAPVGLWRTTYAPPACASCSKMGGGGGDRERKGGRGREGGKHSGINAGMCQHTWENKHEGCTL